MTGKTHLVGGLAIGLILDQATTLAGLPILPQYLVVQIAGVSIPASIIAFTAVGLGSLLPDIDEPNSMVSNLPRVSRGVARKTFRKRGVEGAIRFVVELFLGALNFVTRGLSRLVRLVAMGHRGATHWLVAGVGVSVIAGLAGLIFIDFPDLGFWLFIGYLTHLGLDMMTISGLKVLQPFSNQTCHLLPSGFRIRTGNAIDAGLALLFSVIIGVLAYGPLLQMADLSSLLEKISSTIHLGL